MPALIAVSCEHVTHHYSKRCALDDVTIAIPAGAFAVLVGSNGAGKTTLISLLTGLYSAQQGTIRIFGSDLQRDPRSALRATGVLFQQLSIDLDLTVRENLRYHAALHGLSRRETDARVDEELARLRMLDRLDERVRALSGGMRRRAEIARALLHRPKLLLLDEPTAGLDAATRLSILRHVRGLCRERSTTVVWTTHLLDEMQAADVTLILRQGHVVDPASAAAPLPEADPELIFERLLAGAPAAH